MITAGIDLGSKTIKVVVMKDGKIIGKAIGLSGFDQREAAEGIFDQALKMAKVSRADIQSIMATGTGRKEVLAKGPISATGEVTEVTADAKGAVYFHPKARTVIDVGAEEGRGIKCDVTGRVVDFATNEKCAAGAGTFTEAMARALEVKLEEFGKLSQQSTKTIPMNAQCTVFAESEVVTLVHANTPKADIARSVHDAIANRITSMLRRVGIEEEVVLIGGVAKNPGFVDALKRNLNMNITPLEEMDIAGATGAAIIAGEK